VDDIPLIAIVDDDSMVAEATKGLVETFGFRACTFASGPEFLNSEALASTACLITDVQMPGMTGLPTVPQDLKNWAPHPDDLHHRLPGRMCTQTDAESRSDLLSEQAF
jgi:FixJ family two-component response regulator